MLKLLFSLVTFFGFWGSSPAAAVSAGRSETVTLPLPAPTGPHAVGTQSMALRDATRREIFTKDVGDVRRLAVQIWYPTDAKCMPAPYFPAGLAEVYSKSFGLRPGFEKSVLAHACQGAPIAETKQRLPVVLFSHGLQHTRFSYVSLLEDLASQGNIVIAIDHPYGSRGMIFPDSEVVEWDNHLWARGEDKDKYRAAINEYYRIWADDARQVTNLLFDDKASFLAPSLRRQADLDRVVYFGHSLGGISAIYTAQRDTRIKAAANMDGGIDGRLIKPLQIDVPLLVLGSTANNEAPFYPREAHAAVMYGSNHMSYSDYVWLVERFGLEPWPHADGALAGAPGIDATRNALRLFMDCSLASSCRQLDAELSARAAGPALDGAR